MKKVISAILFCCTLVACREEPCEMATYIKIEDPIEKAEYAKRCPKIAASADLRRGKFVKSPPRSW